ncbi:hypothetical protein F5884DRAFT_673012 [Xylogone sp. PMI_703]|nr:hypothetical protein F5884DRAFT_673012 [Xylogone sp. PMI_703]
MARPRKLAVALSCAFILFTIFLIILINHLDGGNSLSTTFSPISSVGRGWAPRSREREIGRATNETLGFQKIIVVGLKERSDRRDAIALQSSLTGIHVEFIDGSNGSSISMKALPPGMDPKRLSTASIGSWRGHMDAVRRILDNNLSSALIMEDDVDWDIRIKEQMLDFARGSRALFDIPITLPQNSPYGDDWDILWPGHCGEVLPKNDDRVYVKYDDETVPPKAHQPWLKALKEYPEGTRIMHKTGAPICTFAYAVSYKGAQKIMARLGILGGSLAYDNELAFFCQGEVLGVKCVSVQPWLFVHHRGAGRVDKDSDIQNGDENEVREKGFSDQIVLSTRLNIEKLITGETDWVMQW